MGQEGHCQNIKITVNLISNESTVFCSKQSCPTSWQSIYPALLCGKALGFPKWTGFLCSCGGKNMFHLTSSSKNITWHIISCFQGEMIRQVLQLSLVISVWNDIIINVLTIEMDQYWRYWMCLLFICVVQLLLLIWKEPWLMSLHIFDTHTGFLGTQSTLKTTHNASYASLQFLLYYVCITFYFLRVSVLYSVCFCFHFHISNPVSKENRK